MASTPIRRNRKQRAVDAMRQGLKAGLSAEHVLAALDSASRGASWALVLDLVLQAEHGLVRRGSELWGRCDACGGESFSVGRARARCADCGIDMPSAEYIRLQLDRRNQGCKVFR